MCCQSFKPTSGSQRLITTTQITRFCEGLTSWSQVSHMDLAMESCKSSSSVIWSLYFLKDIGCVARSDKWTASKNTTPEEEAKVIFSVSAQTWKFMESTLEERETDAHHVTFHWHKWACLDVLALRLAASPGQIMHRFAATTNATKQKNTSETPCHWGVLLSEMTSPTSCTYVHGDHVLPTVKLS